MKGGLGREMCLLCLSALMCGVSSGVSSGLDRTHRRHMGLHRHRGERGKEGQVLQRSKRGWVWNQFFVIEEYTGPDPVLVGRVSLKGEVWRGRGGFLALSVSLPPSLP